MMQSAWELLPAGALMAAVAALLLTIVDVWKPGRVPERFGLAAFTLAAGLAVATFLALLGKFITVDLSVEQVFLYTKANLAVPWRIAGTWTGREGSLLLWTMYLAIVAFAMAWRHYHKAATDAAERLGRAWTRVFLAGFLVAFLAAVIRQGTFDPTASFFLQGRPEGNGLNPTLKNGFILIHPPIMFLAYALTAVPAAAVLGHLASGTARWGRIGLTWSRVNWLLYSGAITLGGVWAYYTLGFGGYWAWDPVEVANLLPWLALTVYLHAQLQNVRHGAFATVGPFLGLLPFLLTLFSTISTRSGLWVSVHAFTDPTNAFNPDPFGRFLGIMAAEPSLGFFIGLFLATLGIGLGLWCRRLAIQFGVLAWPSRVIGAGLACFGALALLAPINALSAVFEGAWRVGFGSTGMGFLGIAFGAVVLGGAPALWAPATSESKTPSRPRLHWVNLRNLATFAVMALGLALLVLFLFHMTAVMGWSTQFYTARFPWLAAPILVALLIFVLHPILGKMGALVAAGATLGAAAVAAWAVPAHRGGTFLAVLALGLLVSGLERTRRACQARQPWQRQAAHALLALAALLDLAFWLNPPTRIGLGSWGANPVWPVQFYFGAASVAGLWMVHRLMAGNPVRRRWVVFLWVGLLGAYYVAPILAILAWILDRKSGPTVVRPAKEMQARLHQAATYGTHMALALVLVGYAASAYFKDTRQADLAVGQGVDVGGYNLTFAGAASVPETGSPWTATVNPGFSVLQTGKPVGSLDGVLYWEPQTGSHFPLPATLRLWNADIYVTVNAVQLGSGACVNEGKWVQAFQASNRMCAGDPISAVRFEAAVLPGLSLVWTGAALFVFYMALLIASSPRELSGQKGETPESTRDAAQLPPLLSQPVAAKGNNPESLAIPIAAAGGQETP